MNSPCFGRFDACLVPSLSRGKTKSAALTSDHAVAVLERDKETAQFEGRQVIVATHGFALLKIAARFRFLVGSVYTARGYK